MAGAGGGRALLCEAVPATGHEPSAVPPPARGTVEGCDGGGAPPCVPAAARVDAAACISDGGISDGGAAAALSRSPDEPKLRSAKLSTCPLESSSRAAAHEGSLAGGGEMAAGVGVPAAAATASGALPRAAASDVGTSRTAAVATVVATVAAAGAVGAGACGATAAGAGALSTRTFEAAMAVARGGASLTRADARGTDGAAE